MPRHLQTLAEVAEDGEVRNGVPGVCPDGLLGAGETAREHCQTFRDRDLIRFVAERERFAGRRADWFRLAGVGDRDPEDEPSDYAPTCHSRGHLDHALHDAVACATAV